MSIYQPLVAALLGAACLVSACQATPAVLAPAPASAQPAVTVAVSSDGPFVSAAEGTAQIQLNPTYQTGGVRKLLDAVNELTSADINHLVVTLKLKTGGTSKGTVDVPKADLAKSITLGNLAHNTTYTVLAEAYRSAGTTDKISDDADSSVDIVVAQDDALGTKQLKVQLIPVTFSGQATSSGLTVNGGAVTHTGSETVTLNAN
jgi:hypothetical protein